MLYQKIKGPCELLNLLIANICLTFTWTALLGPFHKLHL